MNCKDKLAEDHPEWNDGQLAYHIYNDCPSDFDYHSEPKCGELDGNCTECWDSEVEENEMIYAHVGGEVVGEVESIDMTDDSLTVYTKPVIKDSGNRREFESGAVRDMQEGKGRMDLLPWAAIMEVSKHCENGAKKYGEHNVDRGIPTHSLCDSAARHLAKYLDGWTDEPHLLAAAWNLLWAIQMEIKHKEMVDTPWKKNENIINTTQE